MYELVMYFITIMWEKTFKPKINASYAFKLGFEGSHNQYQHMTHYESDNLSTRVHVVGV